jgi:hypothetical protein
LSSVFFLCIYDIHELSRCTMNNTFEIVAEKVQVPSSHITKRRRTNVKEQPPHARFPTTPIHLTDPKRTRYAFKTMSDNLHWQAVKKLPPIERRLMLTKVDVTICIHRLRIYNWGKDKSVSMRKN